MSFNGTENIIQNYCITFTHNFDHKYSRIKNSFVIKAADVNKEQVLKIAEVLFPNYTDIEIVSITNDELTLTPLEYYHLFCMVRDIRQNNLREQELKNKEGNNTDPYVPTEQEKFIDALFKKMKARMDQFPVYHT